MLRHYTSSYNTLDRTAKEILHELLEQYLFWPEGCDMAPASKTLFDDLLPHMVLSRKLAEGGEDDEGHPVDDDQERCAPWPTRRS